jgi:hypothetical protein
MIARIISAETAGAYVFGTSTSTPIDIMYDESKLNTYYSLIYPHQAQHTCSDSISENIECFLQL